MPAALTAADFVALRLSYGTPPPAEGEWPLSVEHFSQHGTMIDFYVCAFTEAFWQRPEVQALEAPQAVRLREQADAPWLVSLLQGPEAPTADFTLERGEMDALLARFGVSLPEG